VQVQVWEGCLYLLLKVNQVQVNLQGSQTDRRSTYCQGRRLGKDPYMLIVAMLEMEGNLLARCQHTCIAA
jgi:hypothetical protein